MTSRLAISGLHAAYGSVRVLEDVSIVVEGGQTVALLGTKLTVRPRT